MKKVLLFLFTILAFSVVSIMAQDATAQTKEVSGVSSFPGKISLELSQRFDADLTNLDQADSKASGWFTKISDGGSDQYTQTNIKVAMAFDILPFYTMTPWAKDRFDVKINSGVLSPRNRVYFGLKNLVKIPEIVNVGLDVEYRLGLNTTTANEATTKIAAGAYTGIAEHRISPALVVNGSYDFGLSFDVYQYAHFTFFPKLTASQSDASFYGTGFEGNYKVAYDFLRLLNVSWLKGGVFLAGYEDIILYSSAFQVKDASHAAINDNRTMEGTIDGVIGIESKMSNFNVSAGFYNKFSFVANDVKDAATEAAKNIVRVATLYQNYKGYSDWMGAKATVSFSKDNVTVGMNYIGRYMIISNGTSTSDSVVSGNVSWENHLETYVSVKI